MKTVTYQAPRTASNDSRGRVEVEAVRGRPLPLLAPGEVWLMTVPHPRKDIEITLLKLIERQAGIKLRREVADLAVYPAYFEKGEGGHVVVSFPDLPGCCTQGDAGTESEGLTRSGFLVAAARERLARL